MNRHLFDHPLLAHAPLYAFVVCVGALWLSGCSREAPSDGIVVADEIDVIPVSGDSALVIETKTLTVFEELHRHIENARGHTEDTHSDRAASELRRTAEMLNARAAEVDGDVKRTLEGAATEGDRLAQALRDGASFTGYELDDFKAHADIALMGFHLQRTALALDAERPALAGQHLNAAAVLYEYAALHGEGVTEDQATTHDRMRETARWLQAANPDTAAARRDLGEYVRDYEALRLELAHP